MVPVKAGSLANLAVLIVLSLFLFAGCSSEGEGSNETVYLHVYNGYAGSPAMTVFGPTGPLVSNLGFGERTAEPIAFDRNLGSEFQVSLEGTPGLFNFDPLLFEMYPGETATLFVGDRTSESAISTALFRHIRSASPFCRILFHNALSLGNSGNALYNYMAGWYFPDISLAGYNATVESDAFNTVEALVDDFDFTGIRNARAAQMDEVDAFPYFFPTVTEDEEEEEGGGGGEPELNTLEMIWVGSEDFMEFSVDFASGSFRSYRNTRQFVQCLLDEAENAMQADSGNTDAEPPDFNQCLLPDDYNARVFEPDSQEQYTYTYHPSFITGDLSSTSCETELRLFSDFSNIFDGTQGHDGWTENIRVDFETSFDFPQAEHYYFVVYGYPVNPRIAQWTTSHPDFGYEDNLNYPR